ncbi:MAG: hypothetical protein HRU70_02450 [Phycisphaeraceae bacterium]|nr:MAG: hypothetical protein HRU70_02450 [Phycisphaeraceae bacterium]
METTTAEMLREIVAGGRAELSWRCEPDASQAWNRWFLSLADVDGGRRVELPTELMTRPGQALPRECVGAVTRTVAMLMGGLGVEVIGLCGTSIVPARPCGEDERGVTAN